MNPQRYDEPLPVAQAGVGFWGKSWAKLLMSSPYTSLAGIVDPDSVRLNRLADELELPAERRFSSFRDAVSIGGARAALIATPPDTHRSLALEAIDSGLHCLIEKPLAPSMEEANEIVAHAERLDRCLMVGQNYRFRRGPETVRQLIANGALGQVEYVHGRLVKETRLDPGGWRDQLAEPIILDQAVHHLDFVRSVFGLEPTDVRAHTFNPSWSWFDGNACASIELRSKDCYVSYFGSWVSGGSVGVKTSFDGNWEIQGERGCMRWDFSRITIAPTDLGDLIFYPNAVEREAGLLEIPLVALGDEERAGVLKEFAEAILAGREPRSSGRDNLRTLALVFAAEAASQASGWVNISDFVSRSVSR